MHCASLEYTVGKNIARMCLKACLYSLLHLKNPSSELPKSIWSNIEMDAWWLLAGSG